MPLLNVKLPPYTVAKRRDSGEVAFYFQVPARLRPDGWPATLRLPREGRTGRGDAAEIALVIADAERLYASLTGEREARPIGSSHGSIPWLIASFEQSAKYRKSSKDTKRSYAYCARIVTAWSADAGHPHVRLLTRPAILTFLATMDETPRKRNLIAAFIRLLMGHAMDKGVRADNPAVALGLEAAERIKAVHIWTDAELAGKVAQADALGKPSIGTALMILHDQGFRPSDALRLQKGRDYDARTGRFKFRCQKTGEWVECDATSRVRARLDALPREQLVLVVNEATGRPYGERNFHYWFDKVRGAEKHLWARELRHTHVVKARRAGLSSEEIAGRTGHAPSSVDSILAAYYSPHDTEVVQRGAAKFEAYLERKLDAPV